MKKEMLRGKISDKNFNRVLPQEDGCWHWGGYIDPRGYGYTTANGKGVAAHRLIYRTLVGDIPAGMEMDHLCRVRNCVNPTHVEPVTPAENNRRGLGNPNKNKTHCQFGHEFTPENTYVYKGGRKRVCKTCTLDYTRSRRNVFKRIHNG